MIVDHSDIAREAFAAVALQPPPRAVAEALRYISKVLSMLPPHEQAGYVQGPANGENVSPLPDGTFVRVSRVMYPNGQIYKILNDAPNGNPQWVAEDVRPELYVRYAGTHTIVPPQPPQVNLGPLLDRIASLEQHVAQLRTAFAEVGGQIGALNRQIAELSARPAPEFPPLPEYIGTVGPLTVISRPRT